MYFYALLKQMKNGIIKGDANEKNSCYRHWYKLDEIDAL